MLKRALGFAFAILLLAGVFSESLGQDQNVVKHEFEDRTVFVVFNSYHLEVWAIDENDNCVAYPSTISYEDRTIRFPAGTEWEITEIKGDTMRISFPNGEEVPYVRSYRSPSAFCGVGEGKDV